MKKGVKEKALQLRRKGREAAKKVVKRGLKFSIGLFFSVLSVFGVTGIVVSGLFLTLVCGIISVVFLQFNLSNPQVDNFLPLADQEVEEGAGLNHQDAFLWEKETLEAYRSYYTNFEANLFKIAILTQRSLNGYGQTSKYTEVLGADVSDTMFKMSLGVQTTETNWQMYASKQERRTKDVWLDASTVDLKGGIQGPYQMSQGWTLSILPKKLRQALQKEYKNERKQSVRHYYPYATAISVVGTYNKMSEQGLATEKYLSIFRELAPKFGITTDYKRFEAEAVVMLMQTAYLSAPLKGERKGICAFICGVWALSAENPEERGFDNYSLDYSQGLSISSVLHQQFFGVDQRGYFTVGTPNRKGGLRELELKKKQIRLNGVLLQKPLVAEVVRKYWEIPSIQTYNRDVLNYSKKGDQFVLKGVYGIESFLVGKEITEYLKAKIPKGAYTSCITDVKKGTIQGEWSQRVRESLQKSKYKADFGRAYALENKSKTIAEDVTYEAWRLSTKWGVPYFVQSSRVIEGKYGKGDMQLGITGCHVYMNAYIASALTGRVINPIEMMEAMSCTGSLQSNGYYNNTYADVDNVYEELQGGFNCIRGDMKIGRILGEDKEEFEKVVGKQTQAHTRGSWQQKVDKILQEGGLVGLSMGSRKIRGHRFTQNANHYIVILGKEGDSYKVYSYGTDGGYRDIVKYKWSDLYVASVSGEYRGQIYFVWR